MIATFIMLKLALMMKLVKQLKQISWLMQKAKNTMSLAQLQNHKCLLTFTQTFQALFGDMIVGIITLTTLNSKAIS